METGVKVPYIPIRVVHDMNTNKIFPAAVALSLVVHVVILVLAGLSGGSGSTDGEDVFTVNIKQNPDKVIERNEGKNTMMALQLEEVRERARGDGIDTVALDKIDTKYYPYLLQVKERIDRQWSYPEGAFNRGEAGTTVVEFSIARGGSLAACRAVVSSGYESLDMESLRAVRSAAPFAPFSEKFGLARLNIVAQFRYTLAK